MMVVFNRSYTSNVFLFTYLAGTKGFKIYYWRGQDTAESKTVNTDIGF